MTSDHVTTAIDWMPDHVAVTPDIISVQGVSGEGWGKMGVVSPR